MTQDDRTAPWPASAFGGILIPDAGAVPERPAGPSWRRVARASLTGFGMGVIMQGMHVLGPLVPIVGPFCVGFMAAGRARLSPTEGIFMGLGIGLIHCLILGLVLLGGLAIATHLEPPPDINVGLITLVAALLLAYSTLLLCLGGYFGARAENRQ